MTAETVESDLARFCEAAQRGDVRLAQDMLLRVRAGIDALLAEPQPDVARCRSLAARARDTIEQARRCALAHHAHLQHELAHLPPLSRYRPSGPREPSWRLDG